MMGWLDDFLDLHCAAVGFRRFAANVRSDAEERAVPVIPVQPGSRGRF
jgi:hypothetical protein